MVFGKWLEVNKTTFMRSGNPKNRGIHSEEWSEGTRGCSTDHPSRLVSLVIVPHKSIAAQVARGDWHS